MADELTIAEVSVEDSSGGVEEFVDERAINGLVNRGE